MKEFVANLLHGERNLFLVLNGSNSVLLDGIMSAVSSSKIWIPLYVFVLFMIFYRSIFRKHEKQADFRTNLYYSLFVTLFFILLIVCCDQFSSGLIKPIFERPRPGHHPDFKDVVKVVNNHRGGGYSFISGHATNAVGFAVFCSLMFKNRWVTAVALVWGLFIAYSRIYLGMHFVSDVVGGIIVGTLIALSLYYVAFVPLRKKLFKLAPSASAHIYSEHNGSVLAIGFAAYFVGVVLYGALS
ncbi:MAG: phosphatase PAP2 family protein [Bacteroidales bacterium]|jgi:undecaprenyl-diphosphatase|nr:phosphatase PAP2 family protein [Bacteroidales bacterium]